VAKSSRPNGEDVANPDPPCDNRSATDKKGDDRSDRSPPPGVLGESNPSQRMIDVFA